jgi:hypothetical protein
MIHRFIHYVRRQWQIYRAWRHLCREREMRQMMDEMGFIVTRYLNQHDTVECYHWVAANCPRSLRTPNGRRSLRILESMSEIAESNIASALANGLTREDDWAGMPIRIVIEDPRERMLFKLAWGGR